MLVQVTCYYHRGLISCTAKIFFSAMNIIWKPHNIKFKWTDHLYWHLWQRKISTGILIKGIDGHCDNVILIHHPGSHYPQIPKSSLIYTLDVFTASLSPKQLNIALKVHMKKHRDIDQRRIDGHNDNDQLIHIQGCFSSPSDPRWAGRGWIILDRFSLNVSLGWRVGGGNCFECWHY